MISLLKVVLQLSINQASANVSPDFEYQWLLIKQVFSWKSRIHSLVSKTIFSNKNSPNSTEFTLKAADSYFAEIFQKMGIL